METEKNASPVSSQPVTEPVNGEEVIETCKKCGCFVFDSECIKCVNCGTNRITMKTIEQLLIEKLGEVQEYDTEELESDFFPLHVVKYIAESYANQFKAQSLTPSQEPKTEEEQTVRFGADKTTAYDFFNSIPFLDKDGDMYRMQGTHIIEAMKAYSLSCQEALRERIKAQVEVDIEGFEDHQQSENKSLIEAISEYVCNEISNTPPIEG